MAKWGLAGASLILAAALAASPMTLRVGPDGPSFAPGYAYAKHGRGRGGDDRPAGGGASKPGGGVVKVEREGNSIEVVWGNGVKEEIEAGRYERKNAAGDTVVERRATAADRQRLRAIANR